MERNRLSRQELYQESVFDAKADNYDTQAIMLGERDGRNHAIKAQRIHDLLGLASGDKILEIGVGSGLHAMWLLNRRSDIDYTGVDISSRLVKVTEQRLAQYGRRARVQQDNANKLSFSDASFDGIFCAATLHHMESPGHTIAEMARVLRPGGRLVIMEPNWLYPTNIGFMIFLREDRNMFLMRRRNILNWMDDAGLVDGRVENLLYTPPKPVSFIPFYNLLDRMAGAMPGVRRISLMLACSAVKSNSK